jgi:hypothetical protein
MRGCESMERWRMRFAGTPGMSRIFLHGDSPCECIQKKLNAKRGTQNAQGGRLIAERKKTHKKNAKCRTLSAELTNRQAGAKKRNTPTWIVFALSVTH